MIQKFRLFVKGKKFKLHNEEEVERIMPPRWDLKAHQTIQRVIPSTNINLNTLNQKIMTLIILIEAQVNFEYFTALVSLIEKEISS